MIPNRLAAAAAALGLAVAPAGCGGPKTAPVSGTVTYPDGTPAAGGKVVLMPDEPTLPSPVAEFGPDGRFDVYTEKPGDGAPLGRYKVVVLPPGADYSARNPRPIDEKFADPATSGFAITVEDKANTLNLTVTRPAGKK